MSTIKVDSVNNILQRLKFVKNFNTWKDLAHYLDESSATISAWRKRNSPSAVPKITKRCNEDDDIDNDYVLRGDHSKKLSQASGLRILAEQVEKSQGAANLPFETLDQFATVPKYRAKLSGGHGSTETSDQIETNLMFRRSFLKRKGQPDKMALFEVTGESMQPFIYHGDVVLVDMSVNDIEQIVDGKAYAFREDHTVKVKRLSRQGHNIIASSENHMMNPPYHVEKEDFQLIGRVVWVGHEVR